MNIVLFILTIGTTILAGALQLGVNPLEHPEQIVTGVPFSFALIFILLSHEMGHYFVSKGYHIEATLPYLIPAPTFIGTFGAIIKMRSPVTNKKALFDVGAAGPLAGLIVTIPILIIGLKLSEVHVVEASLEEGFTLGTSLFLEFLTWMIFGNLPENYQVIVHPLRFCWLDWTAGNLVESYSSGAVGRRAHCLCSVWQKNKNYFQCCFDRHAGIRDMGVPHVVILGTDPSGFFRDKASSTC